MKTCKEIRKKIHTVLERTCSLEWNWPGSGCPCCWWWWWCSGWVVGILIVVVGGGGGGGGGGVLARCWPWLGYWSLLRVVRMSSARGRGLCGW